MEYRFKRCPLAARGEIGALSGYLLNVIMHCEEGTRDIPPTKSQKRNSFASIVPRQSTFDLLLEECCDSSSVHSRRGELWSYI